MPAKLRGKSQQTPNFLSFPNGLTAPSVSRLFNFQISPKMYNVQISLCFCLAGMIDGILLQISLATKKAVQRDMEEMYIVPNFSLHLPDTYIVLKKISQYNYKIAYIYLITKIVFQ